MKNLQYDLHLYGRFVLEITVTYCNAVCDSDLQYKSAIQWRYILRSYQHFQHIYNLFTYVKAFRRSFHLLFELYIATKRSTFALQIIKSIGTIFGCQSGPLDEQIIPSLVWKKLPLLSGSRLHISNTFFSLFQCSIGKKQRDIFIQVRILVSFFKILRKKLDRGS